MYWDILKQSWGYCCITSISSRGNTICCSGLKTLSKYISKPASYYPILILLQWNIPTREFSSCSQSSSVRTIYFPLDLRASVCLCCSPTLVSQFPTSCLSVGIKVILASLHGPYDFLPVSPMTSIWSCSETPSLICEIGQIGQRRVQSNSFSCPVLRFYFKGNINHSFTQR